MTTRPSTAGRLDVAVLVHDLRGSGVVQNALRIAQAALRGGLTTELWVVRKEGNLVEAVSEGVAVRAICAGPMPKWQVRFADCLAARRPLARLLDHFRPKVLLSAGNHVHALAGAACRASRQRRDMRLILRASNAPVSAPLGLLARPIEGWLLRRDYGEADHVIAVSHELGAILRERLPDETPVTVIPNGVDVSAVRARSRETLEDEWFAAGQPPVVLGVGRLARQKGFDVLIDAFARVVTAGPVRLVIVGSGSVAARRALERRAARRGVADLVRIVGYDANPYRYIARAKLVAISSRWEGGSNVLLEALACGTPVVATSCPTGIREILGDREPVPVGDAGALAKAMAADLFDFGTVRPLPFDARQRDLTEAMSAYVALLREEITRAPKAGLASLKEKRGMNSSAKLPVTLFPRPVPTVQWTAIVLAGQRPGRDPVADACGTHYKALAKVGGEAMLGHVVRALLGSASVGKIVILAQEPDKLFAGELNWITDQPRISFVVSGKGIASSIGRVVGKEAAWPVLVTTADHPLLTPEIVEEFLAGAGSAELGIGFVERATVMTAYPDTRRTWLRFKGGAYSGANLFALRDDSVGQALRLWEKAEQDRKQAFKLFLNFGAVLAVRAITRTIGLDPALAKAGFRLGVQARPVLLSQAEAAIDVDKTDDLALVDAILKRRRRAAGENDTAATPVRAPRAASA